MTGKQDPIFSICPTCRARCEIDLTSKPYPGSAIFTVSGGDGGWATVGQFPMGELSSFLHGLLSPGDPVLLPDPGWLCTVCAAPASTARGTQAGPASLSMSDSAPPSRSRNWKIRLCLGILLGGAAAEALEHGSRRAQPSESSPEAPGREILLQEHSQAM